MNAHNEQTDSEEGLNLGPFSCEARVLTTVYQMVKYKTIFYEQTTSQL